MFTDLSQHASMDAQGRCWQASWRLDHPEADACTRMQPHGKARGACKPEEAGRAALALLHALARLPTGRWNLARGPGY